MLERAVAIIKEMGITAENIQLFEHGERICYLIASKIVGREDEEVRHTVEWVAGLRQHVYADRSRAYTKAAREGVFANFPAKAPPREVINLPSINWNNSVANWTAVLSPSWMTRLSGTPSALSSISTMTFSSVVSSSSDGMAWMAF